MLPSSATGIFQFVFLLFNTDAEVAFEQTGRPLSQKKEINKNTEKNFLFS